MLSINTNVTALYAQLALKQQTQEINRLSNILIDANGGGSTGADLNNVSASVVPTYLTTAIRSSSQANSNIDNSISLLTHEENTLSAIKDALYTMMHAADSSEFGAAQLSIATYISGNSYNNLPLSDGGEIGFQIGYKPNEKISFELPNLTDINESTAEKLSEVTLATFGGDVSSISDAWNAVNQDNGSVKAMISRLGFVQSWLQTDLDRNIDRRSTLLSHAVMSANAQLAVQEMLKNAAQTLLAQANASNQGVIDLIASARIPIH